MDPHRTAHRDATPETAEVRVLLVDDHEVARRGLQTLLESTGELAVVGEAATVADALDWARKHDVDVAVLDIRLPDGNGIELCRELTEMKPDIRCLMLTSFEDDEALLAAYLAGAAGYMSKGVRLGELVETVRQIAAGKHLLEPGLVARVRRRLSHPELDDPLLTRLTRQEHRVLQHLATGSSNREIAEDMQLAEKTVKNYVSSVLMKLGVNHRTQAAVYATRAAGAHDDHMTIGPAARHSHLHG